MNWDLIQSIPIALGFIYLVFVYSNRCNTCHRWDWKLQHYMITESAGVNGGALCKKCYPNSIYGRNS